MPRLEFETTRYGFREAALRPQPDGTVNTKIREVVQPWHVLLPGEPGFERQIVTTVPVDATHRLQFVIQLNPYKPFTQKDVDNFWADAGPDPDDFGRGLPGAETLWGQDRAAMQAGHFSGLTAGTCSAKTSRSSSRWAPLADRSREHLTQSDGSVILNRQLLVRAASQLATGETPPCLDRRVGAELSSAANHFAEPAGRHCVADVDVFAA